MFMIHTLAESVYSLPFLRLPWLTASCLLTLGCWVYWQSWLQTGLLTKLIAVFWHIMCPLTVEYCILTEPSVVCCQNSTGGDVAQLGEHRTNMPLMQVQFPGVARDFLPESTFSADSCMVSIHPRAQSHAFASVRTSKIPQSMSVWWIMETQKHPACTLGWVAQLYCSWLSPGKATWISHERNSIGTIQL